MLKAPLTVIPDHRIKARGLVRTHLKQMSDINREEMERSLDGITDLFSTRITVERMKEISKKVGDIREKLDLEGLRDTLS